MAQFTIQDLQKAVDNAKRIIDEFIARDVDYEEARIQLVMHCGWTMGHATDELEAWETIAGKKLKRL